MAFIYWLSAGSTLSSVLFMAQVKYNLTFFSTVLFNPEGMSSDTSNTHSSSFNSMPNKQSLFAFRVHNMTVRFYFGQHIAHHTSIFI